MLRFSFFPEPNCKMANESGNRQDWRPLNKSGSVSIEIDDTQELFGRGSWETKRGRLMISPCGPYYCVTFASRCPVRNAAAHK